MSESELIEHLTYAFEQAWSNLQWWASISVGLIALASFARKRLSVLIVVGVSFLYTVFTVYTGFNVTFLVSGVARGSIEALIVLRDAEQISATGLRTLEWIDRSSGFNGMLGWICLVGTYVGTISYVWYALLGKRQSS